MFQSNKCDLQNLPQIVWHLKAGRCQSRKNRECGSVGLFEAQPSGLFWPVFQRSNVWLSYHNYFSRTNLFIEISRPIGLLHSKPARMARDALCLPQRDKNNYGFPNLKEQKVKCGIWKICVKHREGFYKSKCKCVCVCVCEKESYRRSWMAVDVLKSWICFTFW